MGALCSACGGRVMPYRAYVFHFLPTAVCGSCGRAVHLRHFGLLVVAFAAAAVALGIVILLLLLRSPALAWAGVALAVLGSILGDYWTYRNLPWDPDGATSADPLP